MKRQTERKAGSGKYVSICVWWEVVACYKGSHFSLSYQLPNSYTRYLLLSLPSSPSLLPFSGEPCLDSGDLGITGVVRHSLEV